MLVVDIGLPDADGRDVCQALRARGIETPVLFLTARDALVDRLAGFDAGGDDYVTKPFALAELVARLQALLRRSGADGAHRGGRASARPGRARRRGGGARSRLTPTEFRLLARLLARPGEAVRRRELVRAGWPHGAIVRENTLDAYVARSGASCKQLDGRARDRDRARRRLPGRMSSVGSAGGSSSPCSRRSRSPSRRSSSASTSSSAHTLDTRRARPSCARAPPRSSTLIDRRAGG